MTGRCGILKDNRGQGAYNDIHNRNWLQSLCGANTSALPCIKTAKPRKPKRVNSVGKNLSI